MKVEEPEIKTEIVRDIHEHEVLLAFNSDCHAIAFHEWWHEDGYIAFKRWAKQIKEPQ